MKDYYARKMKVRTNGFRNCLLSFVFDNLEQLHYRIIVRDVYGQDHEIYNKKRILVRVPSEKHVYHIRYSVKIPEPILFIRLERADLETGEWIAISGLDFMGEYSRDTFKPGRYTLFDSFRWDDLCS